MSAPETGVKQSHGRHYLTVAAGVASACMTALVFNCAGIFLPVVAEDFGAPLTALSLFLTIAALCVAFSQPLWGQLIGKVPMRVLGTICVIVVFLTYMLLSFATNVFFFYAAGVLFGIVMSFLTYQFIPNIIQRWFVTRAGFWVGFCFAFASLAAVVFNPIGSMAITALGWQVAYRIFGIIALVIALPLMLTVRDNPSDLGLEPYGAHSEEAAERARKHEPSAEELSGVPANKAMKSGVFYILCVFVALLGITSGVYQMLPSYAKALPVAADVPLLGSWLSSATMLAGAIGKVGLGYINDKSKRSALILLVICGLLGMLGMWFITESIPVIVGCAFLYGIMMAASSIEPPLIIQEVFGMRDYSKIYSRIMMCQTFVGAFGVTFFSFVLSTFGYGALFTSGIVVAVLVLALGLLALAMGKGLKARAGITVADSETVAEDK